MPVWLTADVPLAQLAVMIITAALIVTSMRQIGSDVLSLLKDILQILHSHADRLARLESKQQDQEGEIQRARNRLDKMLDGGQPR